MENATSSTVPLDELTILVQNGIIIGVKIEDVEAYINEFSDVKHFNGYRTSTDYWDVYEEHIWYLLVCVTED